MKSKIFLFCLATICTSINLFAQHSPVPGVIDDEVVSHLPSESAMPKVPEVDYGSLNQTDSTETHAHQEKPSTIGNQSAESDLMPDTRGIASLGDGKATWEAQNSSKPIDASMIERFINSPCFKEMGFDLSESIEVQEKRYHECEASKEQETLKKIMIISSVVIGIIVLVFLAIKKSKRAMAVAM
jgi:hypothetical protein